MKARLVVESGDWALMKGQGSFDNIDELFALGDGERAAARSRPRRARRSSSWRSAAKTVPDRDAREVAQIMAAELDGLMRAGAQRSRGRAGDAGARGAARGAAAEADRAAVSDQTGGRALRRDPARHRRHRRAPSRSSRPSLARTPGRAQSLLGLARAASVAGPHAVAVKAAKDFLAAWHLADKDRPELAEMRALAR